MAAYEGAHENLMQGVTQQVPRSRLPGQLTSQTNMLSDPVTGLRRRPGAEYRYHMDMPEATSDSITGWRTDISGVSCEVLVESNSGTLVLLDTQGNVLKKFESVEYLQTPEARKLRYAAVGDSLFILNTEKVPEAAPPNTSGLQNPDYNGFFYVRAAAISKSYTIVLRVGGDTYTYTYTTPQGTEPGDAAMSTPEYIVTNLGDQVNAQYSTHKIWVHMTGGYMYITGSDAAPAILSVSTPSGSNYAQASGNSEVREVADLPAVLPTVAEGYIIAVGRDREYTYFQYDSSRQVWKEAGAFDSPSGVSNMPLEVYWDEDWKISTENYEGRISGDDESNPVPEFVDWGITGLSSYQGRLVVLSGPWVYLSATNTPRRFFRSTVTEVLDTDPIALGSSSAASAAFQYALPANKDLLLFSSGYQALIPSGNQALTPRNAQVVVTSDHAADMTSGPVSLGRTVMYPMPRSQDFFGIMEMVPSSYTDSQYVSGDSTEHLPKYLAGRCRFGVSSSVANMAVFGPSRDTKTLVVHEYSWDGDDKVQRAWHQWRFPTEVAGAYFSGDVFNILTVSGGVLTCLKVDPRVGLVDSTESHRPRLDAYIRVPLVDRVGQLPEWYVRFVGDELPKLRATAPTGNLQGSEVGIDVGPDGSITANPSYTGDSLYVGFGYRSSFAPSPPLLKDRQGIPITTGRQRLVYYHAELDGTQEFSVRVSDHRNDNPQYTWDISPVLWTSPELSLTRSPVSGNVGVSIPCRVNSLTSNVEIFTEGLGELNILSLEFVIQTNQRIRRV